MLQKILQALLDLFLPQSDVERELATLSAEAWLLRAGTSPSLEGHHIAIAPYKNPFVRSTVHALKYKGNKDALRIAGALLREELLTLLSDIHTYNPDTSVVLLPIPLSKQRLHERGHNQASLIAHAMLDDETQNICTPLEDVLIRTRHTESQTKLSRAERLKNMHGVFAVMREKEHLVQDAIAIVVDDVITTGATICDAEHALLSVGAREVYGLALAH